ncbi:MAG: Mur ligase family protein [Candidatus Binatia bacterium]
MRAAPVALTVLVDRARRRGLVATLHDPEEKAATISIRGVRLDSRLIEVGDLYFALPGSRVDGSVFVADARRRGAAAVACDPAHVPEDLPAVVIDDVASACGYLTSAFWQDPSDSVEVVGITGTNGKTSCTYLLEAVWKAAGRRPGVIGTISQRCAAFDRPSAMTTPSQVDLQALLAEMRATGTDAVAMEVSSHALAQRRVAGCRFRAALFTNLTRDHLDYHDTEDSYFAAKASLFREWLVPGHGVAVLNADDARVAKLAGELSRHDVWTVSTTPGVPARGYVVSASCTLAGIEAVFDLEGDRLSIRSPLVGAANLCNLLSVAALAMGTGVPAEAIRAGLAGCRAVPGRMEKVLPARPVVASPPPFVPAVPRPATPVLRSVPFGRASQFLMRPPAPAPRPAPAPPRPPEPVRSQAAGEDETAGLPIVFVDYAHTPDALERSLRALAGEVAGRVIVVFGCGGDRDRGKRPLMGRIAAELAKVVILTSDNPRSEEPHAILEEIEIGLGARLVRRSAAELAEPGTGGYLVEADRLVAIETAITIAAPDDLVLVAGKGHEDYQEIAGTKRHFDDREVARTMLARRRDQASRASG